MDNNNSLFIEEEWEDIQKILEENARASKEWERVYNKIMNEDK